MIQGQQFPDRLATGQEALAGGESVHEEDSIVLTNLAMLKGSNFGEVLMNESMGGNAGTVELNGQVVPCAGVNGYADKASGRITVFGNSQNVDPVIVARDSHFTLRVAMLLSGSVKTGLSLSTTIVGLHGAEDMDPLGKAKFEAAIKLWNAEQEAPGE